MATGPRAAVGLIASRRFGPYFVGNALSASGGWFQNLAASLLVYRLTGSELLLGVLTFAQFAPILLLAPWSGAAADRFDRRRLLLVTQPASAAISALLAVVAASGVASAATVIGLALAAGVAGAFTAPAQQALVASLVRDEEIPSAVALNSMTFNIARSLGPVAAAATVEAFGLATAFVVNSASFLVFAAALLFVRPRPYERGESFRLRDSIRLVLRRPRLAAFLLIVAAVGMSSDPINTLAPAFANAFGRRDTFAGVVIAVFGAGAVTAAFAVAGHARSRRRTAATLGLFAVGLATFSVSPWLPLGLVFLFAAGFGYLASNAAATTQLQLEVAEGERGRIMALWTIAFLGVRPIASLIDGAIASAAGVRVAGTVMALPVLAAAAAILLLDRGRA